MAQLSIFEGMEPEDAEIRLSGGASWDSDLHIGDEVKLQVSAQVVGVTHELKSSRNGPLFVRSHKLVIQRADPL